MIISVYKWLLEALFFPGRATEWWVKYVPVNTFLGLMMLAIAGAVQISPEATFVASKVDLPDTFFSLYSVLFSFCSAALLWSSPNTDELKFWTLPLLIHVTATILATSNIIVIAFYAGLIYFIYRFVYDSEGASVL